MRLNITLLIAILVLSGCSSISEGVTPDEDSNLTPQYRILQNNRWNWHTGLYYVSEDHTTIEEIPNRVADWHVNVNTFVEQPFCKYCLMIGKPQIQPDGTFKVKVILSHPFPGQPYYTGFDVRGTVMFQATRYWEILAGLVAGVPPNIEHPFDPPWITPLYFSRAEDGGGQLLNADGFSMYLFPGLDLPPHLPISKYSKGQYASGPDPDSTINGYKLFTKDPERRMFLVTDTIVRTYHIDPPDGEFIFGYVVDASWAAPTATPVTNPKNDFPFWASCEEGYVLEFEQLDPFKTGTYGNVGDPNIYDVTRVKFLSHKETPIGFSSYLACPDIIPDPDKKIKAIAHNLGIGNQEEPGIYVVKQEIHKGTYEALPGQYIAVLFGHSSYYDWPEDDYPIQFNTPPFVDFIYLDVIEGDE